eukprot:TRINITY_DN9504_c0_g1_i1.p1 TRINITY_DN9504_c0_g1~~TRINITY_DN9504_c0_g1_i1.p1  ORF type:complete len:622 (-),score=80.81 TRINITY_DN9504_c0_g1_i1:18-1655(-)
MQPLCEGFVSVGQLFWVPPGYNATAMADHLGATITSLSLIVDDWKVCRQRALEHLCMEAFPTCNISPDGNAQPGQVCQAFCWETIATCDPTPIATIARQGLSCTSRTWFPTGQALPRYPDGPMVFNTGFQSPCLLEPANLGSNVDPPCPYLSERSALGGPCEPLCNFPVYSWDPNSSMEGKVTDAIAGASYISLVLSFLGLITWLGTPSKRQYPSVMVAYLCICTFFIALGYLLSSWSSTEAIRCTDSVSPATGNQQPVCMLQAFLVTYFTLALFLWWCCTAANIFIWIVLKPIEHPSYHRTFHCISWGLPLLLSTIGMGGGYVEYIPAFQTCFYRGEAAQYGLFHGWLLLLTLLGTVMMGAVIRKMVLTRQLLGDAFKSGKERKIVSKRTIGFVVCFNLIAIVSVAYNLTASDITSKLYDKQIAYFNCVTALVLADPGRCAVDINLCLTECRPEQSQTGPFAVFAFLLQNLLGLWVFLLFVASREFLNSWRTFSSSLVGTKSPTQTQTNSKGRPTQTRTQPASDDQAEPVTMFSNQSAVEMRAV